MARSIRKEYESAAAPRKSPKRESKARKPISIRFSKEEWEALDRAAGKIPVGTFVRRKALDGLEVSQKTPEPRPTRHRNPVKDAPALAKLLGELGRSRIASNLNQIARAAHMGAITVSPEAESALTQACAEVNAMRADLIRALGLKVEE